jgi:hypothetical protein
MSTLNFTLFADLDERDLLIAAKRMAAFLERNGPQVGDYVLFADGIERRISHIWDWDDLNPDDRSIQTSDGGSFYLSESGLSFSGSLYPSVKAGTLRHSGSIRKGACWFFHHDHHCAHNGVTIEPPIFNQWTSTKGSTR